MAYRLHRSYPMTVARLTSEERESWLASLPGWALAREGAAIERTFQFKDFSEAFAFMTRVAMLSEQADHHPEWYNVYNRVEVTLTTHDANGLSLRDVNMATRIDALLR